MPGPTDPEYLTCAAGGAHTLGEQYDAAGVVTCTRCGWQAEPAWIARLMVTMSAWPAPSSDGAAPERS